MIDAATAHVRPAGAVARGGPRTVVTAVALVALASVLVWVLVLTEISTPLPQSDWVAFVIAAVALGLAAAFSPWVAQRVRRIPRGAVMVVLTLFGLSLAVFFVARNLA